MEDWRFEQSGSSWFLYFRSSPETKRHIIGALPRAVDVGTLKYDPEWPYRIRFDFVVRKHLWLAEATRVLLVPGHTSSSSASSVRLGAAVAEDLGIPTTEVLALTKVGQPAKQMTRLQRRALSHEYYIEEELDGQTVLILDDFYHTGWTMAGVANAARRAGAKTVLGLVAVRNYQH